MCLLLLGPPQQGLPLWECGIVEGHHWTQPCGSVDMGLVLTTHHPAHFSLGLGYLALQEMLLLFKPFSFKAPGLDLWLPADARGSGMSTGEAEPPFKAAGQSPTC